MKNISFGNKKKSLIETIKILEKNKIKYFIEGGLFLGAARDNRFIEWDWDFEIGLYYEQVKHKILHLAKIFSKKGFRISYISNNKENMKINIFLYDDVKISLIPYYLENNLRKRYSWKIPAYVFDKVSTIKFLGRNISCPHLDYLDYTYGNWKKIVKSNTPKKYLNPNFLRNNYYLKILYNVKKIFYFYLKLKRYLLSMIYGRENNFQYVIHQNVKKKSLFIDIGSSDGDEAKIALNKFRSVRSIIFEPYAFNRKKIFKNLNRKCYINRFKVYDYCISDRNSKINFYTNPKKTNLNSTTYFQNSIKVKKNSMTFDEAAKKFKFTTPIFIKADIEGGEEKLLKGAKNFLYKKNDVSILLELHPDKYKDNKFKNIIKSLIKNGYKIRYIESAGSPIPIQFKENKLQPIRIYNNRGLYKNINNKFILNNAFSQNYYLSKSFEKGFVDKSVRFIFLQKN
jgi:FkbM family methyltransferase